MPDARWRWWALSGRPSDLAVAPPNRHECRLKVAPSVDAYERVGVYQAAAQFDRGLPPNWGLTIGLQGHWRGMKWRGLAPTPKNNTGKSPDSSRNVLSASSCFAPTIWLCFSSSASCRWLRTSIMKMPALPHRNDCWKESTPRKGRVKVRNPCHAKAASRAAVPSFCHYGEACRLSLPQLSTTS